jgi:pimeloyl-ACP methyl ester carboxylesterase
VKAVLALSPYSTPFDAHETIGGLAVPVMFQGGTRDVGITPQLAKAGGTYDGAPSPKYFVEFNGAGHFAWTDLRSTFHESIDAYSIAFMDRYVKGSAGAMPGKRPDVGELRSEAK